MREPTSSELGEFAVDGIALDRLRIEGGAVPFGQLGMALVSWIDDGLEELGIAPGSANVFGRAAALGLDQAGIGETRCWIADALDLDRMFPAIAEVVEIFEGLGAGVLEQLEQACLGRLERAVTAKTPAALRWPPADVADPDLPQVRVGPADGRLQDQVQPIEPKVERHLEATHDGRLDVVERDLETDDRIGAHAARADVVAGTVHRQGNSSSIRLAG